MEWRGKKKQSKQKYLEVQAFEVHLFFHQSNKSSRHLQRLFFALFTFCDAKREFLLYFWFMGPIGGYIRIVALSRETFWVSLAERLQIASLLNFETLSDISN